MGYSAEGVGFRVQGLGHMVTCATLIGTDSSSTPCHNRTCERDLWGLDLALVLGLGLGSRWGTRVSGFRVVTTHRLVSERPLGLRGWVQDWVPGFRDAATKLKRESILHPLASGFRLRVEVLGSSVQDAHRLPGVIDSGFSGRGATRAEDVQGTPTQSHISPSILVYEENP